MKINRFLGFIWHRYCCLLWMVFQQRGYRAEDSKKMKIRFLSKLIFVLLLGLIVYINPFEIHNQYLPNNTSPLLAAPQIEHPHLLFDKEEIPVLRQKVTTGEPKQIWKLLEMRCEDHLQHADSSRIEEHGNNRELEDFFTDLGFAYLISGDSRYGRRAIELMVAWANRKPNYPFWQGHYHNVGDVLCGLAVCYDWTYDLMSNEEREKIKDGITDLSFQEYERSFNLWWGTGEGYNNWTGVKAAGFGLAGLAVQSESGRSRAAEDSLIQRAEELVEEYLNVNYGIDGEGYEGILYTTYALKHAAIFATALKHSKGKDLLASTNAGKVFDYIIYNLLPDKWFFHPSNDSRYHLSDFPAFSAAFLSLFPVVDKGIAGWFWENYSSPRMEDNLYPYRSGLPYGIIWYQPVEPERPETKLAWAKEFRTFGQAIFRTGWESDDILSCFDTKQNITIDGGKKWLSRYHLHEDVTNFCIYAYGARFAVDSEYGRAETEFHNNVLIDGNGQSSTREGELEDFTAGDFYGLVVGRTLTSYSEKFEAWRYYVIVKGDNYPPFFVCIDDFQKNDGMEHSYSWLLQSSYGFDQYSCPDTNRIVVRQNAAEIIAPNGSRMELYFIHPNDINITVSTPQEIPRLRTVRLCAEANAVNPYFIVIMIPRKHDIQAPEVNSLKVENGFGTQLDWTGTVDYLLFRGEEGDTLSSTGYSSDGKLIILRNHGERILLQDGTLLKKGSQVLINTFGQKATVLTSEKDVVVKGTGVSQFIVYAPDAEVAVLNGQEVEVRKEGEFVYFPINLGMENSQVDNQLRFKLKQNYPNPFNSSCLISYELSTSGRVELKIYNLLGEEIQTLIKDRKRAGFYTIKFNGQELPSGIYFYWLVINGNFKQVKKMILMK